MFHMQRHRRLPEEHARFYSAEISLALNFLHDRGVWVCGCGCVAVWVWVCGCGCVAVGGVGVSGVGLGVWVWVVWVFPISTLMLVGVWYNLN